MWIVSSTKSQVHVCKLDSSSWMVKSTSQYFTEETLISLNYLEVPLTLHSIHLGQVFFDTFLEPSREPGHLFKIITIPFLTAIWTHKNDFKGVSLLLNLFVRLNQLWCKGSARRALIKNRQSKSVCGYWHSTISIVLKRTRGWIMTLERSFAEYVSHAQQKTCCIPRTFIYEYHVPQAKDNARICCLNDIQPIIKW